MRLRHPATFLIFFALAVLQNESRAAAPTLSCGAHNVSLAEVAPHRGTCAEGVKAMAEGEKEAKALEEAAKKAAEQSLLPSSQDPQTAVEEMRGLLNNAEKVHQDLKARAGRQAKKVEEAARKSKVAASQIEPVLTKLRMDIDALETKYRLASEMDLPMATNKLAQQQRYFESQGARAKIAERLIPELRAEIDRLNSEIRELTKAKTMLSQKHAALVKAIDEQNRITQKGQQIRPNLLGIEKKNAEAIEKIAGMRSRLQSTNSVAEAEKAGVNESGVSGVEKGLATDLTGDGTNPDEKGPFRHGARSDYANEGYLDAKTGKVVALEAEGGSSADGVQTALKTVRESNTLSEAGLTTVRDSVTELGGAEGTSQKYASVLTELDAKAKGVTPGGYLPTSPEDQTTIQQSRESVTAYNETYDRAAKDPAIRAMLMGDGVKKLEMDSTVYEHKMGMQIGQVSVTPPDTGGLADAVERSQAPNFDQHITEVVSKTELNAASSTTTRNQQLAAIDEPPSFVDKVSNFFGMRTAEEKVISDNPYGAGVVAATDKAAVPVVQSALTEAVKEEVVVGVGTAVVPVAGSMVDVNRSATWAQISENQAVQSGLNDKFVANSISAQEDLQMSKAGLALDVATMGVGGKAVSAGRTVNAMESVASTTTRHVDTVAHSTPRITNTVPISTARSVDPVVTPVRTTSTPRLAANDNARFAANDNFDLAAVPEQRVVNAAGGDSLVKRVEPTTISPVRAETVQPSLSREIAQPVNSVETAQRVTTTERVTEVSPSLARRVDQTTNPSTRMQGAADNADRAAEANRIQRQAADADRLALERANAHEEVRLNAMTNKSKADAAARAEAALRAEAAAKATARNDTAEALRNSRQLELEQTRSAQLNADRAAQTEANALRRQAELDKARAEELAEARRIEAERVKTEQLRQEIAAEEARIAERRAIATRQAEEASARRLAEDRARAVEALAEQRRIERSLEVARENERKAQKIAADKVQADNLRRQIEAEEARLAEQRAFAARQAEQAEARRIADDKARAAALEKEFAQEDARLAERRVYAERQAESLRAAENAALARRADSAVKVNQPVANANVLPPARRSATVNAGLAPVVDVPPVSVARRAETSPTNTVDWSQNLNFGSPLPARQTAAKTPVQPAATSHQLTTPARLEAQPVAVKKETAVASNFGASDRESASRLFSSADSQVKKLEQSHQPSRYENAGGTRVIRSKERGGPEIKLEQETVGGQTRTTLSMNVADGSSSVPMRMTVPNDTIKLKDAEVIKRAGEYVAQSRRQLAANDNNTLYDLSKGGGSALAYRGRNTGRSLASRRAAGVEEPAVPQVLESSSAKSASDAMAQPPKTISGETVPELLTKENIPHLPLDDTQALIEPSVGNKFGRFADKVKKKYGTEVFVDEEIEELGAAAMANRHSVDFAPSTVRSSNKAIQGPTIVHEAEHVNNSAKLARMVDEGRVEFDWRNISFGSDKQPTGLKLYDQMGIDEVMAYRRGYNQSRFDAAAALKAGDSQAAEASMRAAEFSAAHYEDKLLASATYLQSAGRKLDEMKAARLITREQTKITDELMLGVPDRAAKVKSVQIKEISDGSGRSITLVKTKYADNREFTQAVMRAEDYDGRIVPMRMPVPNNMMALPEKVVVAEAHKFVRQARGKMDTYEALFQKSASAKSRDFFAQGRALDGPEGGPALAMAKGRSPAAKVDDPSLLGQKAAAQTDFTPRTLQEMADRRVNWVLKEHSEFSAISAADNRKFMDLAARAEKGQAKESFFVTENAVLKRLNDDVVKDKDFVTALDNLHKEVLLREIKKDPVLKDVVVASYNDYKSVGFALKRNDAHVRRLLDEKIAKTNQDFDDFLKKVEVAKGWKEKSIGLASDMRTWHHSGIGKTFQEAGLAARRSRELALDSGNARLVNFADESSHYIAATDRMSARSKELATKFKSAPFLEKTPHGTALSEEALETIRKAKPLGKSESDMNLAAQAALKKRYQQDISLDDVSLLRSQLKDIDAVNPSLLIEKRVEINMGLHDEGVVSFDFKGQNSRNLYQTQMAILKSQGKDMKTRLEAIAEGDRLATAQLDDMKARVEKAVSSLGEKYVGKDVSKVVQKSGDDGIFHPLAELGPVEKAKLAKALNEQKVGDAVRLTYLPKNYRNSKEMIPVVDRNRLVVEAEKIEKDLFTEHLVGELPDEVFKGMQVKVDLNPAKEGKSAVGLTLSHASGKQIPAKAEEIARRVLEKKYDISHVDRPGVTAGRAPAASSTAGSTGGYSPLKIAKSVDSAKVFATHQQWTNKLTKMGVDTIPSGMEPALSRAVKQKWYGDIELRPMTYTDGSFQPFHGEILVVNKLPPAVAKASGTTPALVHPEMAAYLKKMRARGYDLATDTSHSHLGMGAYFDPDNRIISIGPDSNWAVFKHEFQHLEFYESISNPNILDTMKEIRLADKKDLVGTMHPAYVKSVGADKIRRIQKLLDRGVTTELAINESLSVQDELKAFGWRRYIPSGSAAHSYRYMLRHQITELEALGSKMTAQQRKLVQANKLKHTLSEKAVPAAVLGAGGVAAAGTGAGGVYAYQKIMEEEPDQIFYDSEGRAILLMKDGTLKYR